MFLNLRLGCCGVSKFESPFASQIDTYGSFPFVLLKVADRTGMNKLLVRGKNYSSDQSLLQVWLRPADEPLLPPANFCYPNTYPCMHSHILVLTLVLNWCSPLRSAVS